MKLKRISLVGFKSFADKTVFDFHDGITAIVGPNGCGKSNVVDAFKWVLGEQSAKSLRGGEMMDVIFNGTPSRRCAGYAEVSLTFEDFEGWLKEPDELLEMPALPAAALQVPSADAPLPGLDAPSGDAAAQGQYVSQQPPKPRKKPQHDKTATVTITRRLYRNGESEYIINNKAARLKDIREMFLDTGAGIDAYSVIEQGRVEAFLVANAADRRALFDEAAGISKYKSRKKEALRRLERVEQNLLRLTDILEEVEKRLRSIKYQAGKARNYQEYSTRLTELRSLFSLAEYHRLGKQRQELQAAVAALTDQLSGLHSQIDQLEAAGSATQSELADLESTARTLEGQIAATAGQIDGCNQRAQMLRRHAQELADSAASEAARCQQSEGRGESGREEAEAHRQQLGQLERQLDELARREQGIAAEQSSGHQALAQSRASLEDEKNGTIDLLRRSAALHNEINSFSIRRETLSSQRQKLQGRSGELAAQAEGLMLRRAEAAAGADQAGGMVEQTQQRLDAAASQSAAMEQETQHCQEELSRAQQAHSAMLSRQSVLAEMQQRLEGVGSGVRKALQAARQGRLGFIHGMLGEFIETDVEHAKAVEAAMVGADQHLIARHLADVLASAEAIKAVLGESEGVEFICLDQMAQAAPTGAETGDAQVSTSLPAAPSDPAVVGRVFDWIRCEAALAGAVEAMLGQTLIVNSLADAVRLAADGGHWRYVTTTGEILEPDGHVRIGSGKTTSGVVWRKSELADLARRLEDGRQDIEAMQQRRSAAVAQRQHIEQTAAALRTALVEVKAEHANQKTTMIRLDEQVAQLRRELPLLDQEMRQMAQEIDAAVAKEHEARQKALEMEAMHVQRQERIALLQGEVDASAKRQETLNSELTAARVALAESRQKRSSVQENLTRIIRAGEALVQEVASLRKQIESAQQRRSEAQSGAEEALAQAATLQQRKDELAIEADDAAQSRRSLEQRLEEIRQHIAAGRKNNDAMAERANQGRVQLNEVEVRIEGLITRTAEEIGLDIPAVYTQYTHDDARDWEAVRLEIADLRGKIERLGNVNLDAIAEQEELTKREQFLQGQLADIQESQKQLADLIKRINVESKRRFEESFQAVRVHFNDLFRKLFGGGKADIVMSNPDDPLESDIDIIARPPGKETRSITLLSGGEKTMTALALLFSFFKSRPSPFCLLDEVDAALDEANTGRFALLVREFLSTSQFVIVSHSKRTIGMADQIYGVTMQEPGVSRPISVRFEEAQELAETTSGEAISA